MARAEEAASILKALRLGLHQELAVPTDELVLPSEEQVARLLPDTLEASPPPPTDPRRRKDYLAFLRQIDKVTDEVRSQTEIEQMRTDWPTFPPNLQRDLAAYNARRRAVYGGALTRLADLREALLLAEDLFDVESPGKVDWPDCAYSLFWLWDLFLRRNSATASLEWSNNGPCTRYIKASLEVFDFQGVTLTAIDKQLRRWESNGHFEVRAGQEHDNQERLRLS